MLHQFNNTVAVLMLDVQLGWKLRRISWVETHKSKRPGLQRWKACFRRHIADCSTACDLPVCYPGTSSLLYAHNHQHHISVSNSGHCQKRMRVLILHLLRLEPGRAGCGGVPESLATAEPARGQRSSGPHLDAHQRTQVIHSVHNRWVK
jgi:hypothetical protein